MPKNFDRSQFTSRIQHLILQKIELMTRLSPPRQLKHIWLLLALCIAIIGSLGTLLVMMSQEKAHLILAIGITLMAAAVVMVAGYMCLKFIVTHEYRKLLAESCKSLNMGVILTNDLGELVFYNDFLEQHFDDMDTQTFSTFCESYFHESMATKLLQTKRKLQNQEGSSNESFLLSTNENPASYWLVDTVPILERPGYSCWIFRPQEHDNDIHAPISMGEAAITNFQRVFENAPMGIMLIDRDGQIRASNRSFRANIYHGDVSVDENFFDLIHQDHQGEIRKAIEKILSGKKIPLPLEIHFSSHNAAPVSAFASRLRVGDEFEDEEQANRGVILHFFDNSEQKRLHLQLVQSQKMQAMGQLAGGIAHDFNNLLTAMIGFCDLILLRHSPGDQSFTDIMQIKQNANRAANLVRQLLAFSKQQTLQPQVLDMSEILSELTVLLQRLVGVNVDLEIIHGRDLGFIKVDKGQFEQVIINLVVNARDAMNEEGNLKVRTYNKKYKEPTQAHHERIPPGDYVVIEVEDTGCGISPENLTRIFDPFFSTKELGQGTGLGLSTVYGIVKQTDGYILVESEPEKGTKISVIFPFYDPNEARNNKALKEKSSAIKDLTGKGNILFVEDEDAVRLFGARALRDKGYRVIEASSGEEALNFIETQQDTGASEDAIDLMVTDVVMPAMDGVELVKEVYKILPELKIIYISGYAEDSFREKVGSDENIHFLPKPFSLKELATKVKGVMDEETPDKIASNGG